MIFKIVIVEYSKIFFIKIHNTVYPITQKTNKILTY